MKTFSCHVCQQMVYFENTHCENCQTPLGYDPSRDTMLSLQDAGDGSLRSLSRPRTSWRRCGNSQWGACNWLIPATAPATQTLCEACLLNRTIPNLNDPDNLVLWRRMEQARHRLVYGLLRLRLPVKPMTTAPDGLAFDILEGPELDNANLPPVTTGHENGVITINLAEADDVHREQTRTDMSERYRTLLGHFRHEIGHYYWDQFFKNPKWPDQFRKLFGDEREDYAQSMQRHYDQPLQNWQQDFVSQYASMHPWEDWAETWSHYLHIIDTLETANSFRIKVDPRVRSQQFRTVVNFNPYTTSSFERIIDAWIPLSCALNSLSRSMGQQDLYPFVLPERVVEKLAFVHRTVKRGV